MRKFRAIPNVRLVTATDSREAAKIVTFLNCHACTLGCDFYSKDCSVYASLIKPSRINYILGVIAGFLLSK